MTKRPRKVVKSSRDTYLQKRYGITEKEFLAQLNLQSGSCKICKITPLTGAKNLHVDHDHKIERWKIISKKVGGLWISFPQNGKGKLDFQESSRLKQESRSAVKKRLLRLSVRFLLCWKCNTGLQKWRDNPEHLAAAAEYLNEYQRSLYE